MTSGLDTGGPGAVDRTRGRAYLREFVPAMAAYVVVLAGAVAVGQAVGPGPGRLTLAVLPVVPTCWVVRAVVRHLRRVDEYQRLLLLEGLAGGFVTAMLTAVAGGLLGFFGLDGGRFGVAFGCWAVYVAGMAGWIVTARVLTARADRA